MEKRLSDADMIKALNIDSKTLVRFKEIQKSALKEAKIMDSRKHSKIKVLGISASSRDEFDTSQEMSNTEELLKVCLEECKSLGAETELLPLRKYDIRYCKACYSTVNTQCHFKCTCYPKGPKGDDMTNIIYDKLVDADVIIFATPVNNFKISALMSLFIDRCISMDGSLEPANLKVPKDKSLNRKHMEFVKMVSDNNVLGSGMLRRFLGKVAGIITAGHEEGASMAISTLFMTLNNYGMIFPPFSHTYAMSSICKSTYEDKPIVLNKCHRDDVKTLAKNLINCAKVVRNVKPSTWKYEYSEN